MIICSWHLIQLHWSGIYLSRSEQTVDTTADFSPARWVYLNAKSDIWYCFYWRWDFCLELYSLQSKYSKTSLICTVTRERECHVIKHKLKLWNFKVRFYEVIRFSSKTKREGVSPAWADRSKSCHWCGSAAAVRDPAGARVHAYRPLSKQHSQFVLPKKPGFATDRFRFVWFFGEPFSQKLQRYILFSKLMDKCWEAGRFFC